MARESHPRVDVTPKPRAASADPAPSTSRRSIKTPGSSQARGVQRPQGLSASGRKPPPLVATPHARAALRAIDSRRAAIFTPHRARRQSLREARETPRDFLLPLGRVLARNTNTINSSSSPRDQKTPGSGGGDADGDTIMEEDEYDDEDDDLPKRPRLSLPIDADDDDSDLQPHRSAGLEDDNLTARSIELPRRAFSEQPGSRYSLASMRMSDYFNGNDVPPSEEVGIDSGFFPPRNAIDQDTLDLGAGDISAYERLDSDVGRRDTAQFSDFEIEVPVNMNEDTFMIAPQAQESPTHEAPGLHEPVDESEALDAQSDDDNGVPEPELAEEASDAGSEAAVEAFAKSDAQRSTKKRAIKVSKYGIECPSLPPAVVKRLAQTFAKTSGAKGKITPDALKVIMQASDWFFEQLGDDLQAYAKHAGRKTIEESDMLTIMKRQRQTNPHTTPFALAQRHLPRELLQELRMTPPAPLKRRRKAGGGNEDEEIT
ncbi:centromere kinetochore component CENP-T-domain-containing protein [Lasiosphaeria ovina]|uniref:Centromere kinetochore component CENP-T-domain-containing protein n=1 Tax=Lasiosphaeria ovina TaxID=92902 RepID=A0AAE0JZ09_9PEZI|nr:centromere kinetochore component CENP-T-domain-containing protein [Lasiosphaeria ovina]